jgi:hypothetical protein
MKPWQTLAVIILCVTASTARGETVEIAGDYGGFLVAYEAKFTKLAAEHATVRIAGPCVSACTIVSKFIPREDI